MKQGFQLETMGLSFLIWLCSLPLIWLIVSPRFGLKTAGTVAAVLLLVLTAICWFLCGWKFSAIKR